MPSVGDVGSVAVGHTDIHLMQLRGCWFSEALVDQSKWADFEKEALAVLEPPSNPRGDDSEA